MTALELTSLHCPRCRHPLPAGAERQRRAICPHCDEHILLTGGEVASSLYPERIIPFALSEQDFEQHVTQIFVQHPHAARDLIEQVSFGSARAMYLPMYHYAIKYHLDYSCQIADKAWRQPKTPPQSQLHQGSKRGELELLSIAYEGDELPPALLNYAHRCRFDAHLARPFQEHYLSDRTDSPKLSPAPQPNLDVEEVWHRHVHGYASDVARDKLLEMLSEQDVTTLKHELTIESKQARLVLIPFWYIDFHYKGEPHYALMEGSTGQQQLYSLPYDEKLIHTQSSKQRLTTLLNRLILLLYTLASVYYWWDYLRPEGSTEQLYLLAIGVLLTHWIFNALINYQDKKHSHELLEAQRKREHAARRNLAYAQRETLREPSSTTSPQSHTLRARYAYILLALLGGVLGLHNFYAGHSRKAYIQLIITTLSMSTLLLIPLIWSWIDCLRVKRDAKGIPMS